MFQNIIIKIVWKSSLCSLLFQGCFDLLVKMFIWFKKVSSVKRLPITDVESSVETIFDLDWKCKKLLTQNRWIWIFNATEQHFRWRFYKCVDNIQNVTKLKFAKDWTELRSKNAQTVWKSSFCSLHFEWCFNFLEKILSDVESSVESIFDQSWKCKILLTQSH